MKQQINLYQAQFHLQQVSLPARQMVMITGAILVCIGLTNGGLLWSNYRQAQQHAQLTQREQALQDSVAELQQRLNAQAIDTNLLAQTNEAQRQLQARQRMTQWLEKSLDSERIVFSELLSGLSRQHVQGVWLSQIAIDSGGDNLRLQGYTVKPDLLPEYLSKLSAEPAYAGREFRKVSMRQTTEQPNALQFLLTTELPISDDEGFAQ